VVGSTGLPIEIGFSFFSFCSFFLSFSRESETTVNRTMAIILSLCYYLAFLHFVSGYGIHSSFRRRFYLQMSSSEQPRVRLGTRASPLALAQAFETKRLLANQFPELRSDEAVEIRKIITKVSFMLRSLSTITLT
jgi:hypothetical protein